MTGNYSLKNHDTNIAGISTPANALDAGSLALIAFHVNSETLL